MAWKQTAFQLLGEVKPLAPPQDGGSHPGHEMDESEMAIEDVKASRRLVLTTAGKLIAEQDPTRLDNLVFSVGPFALAGVLKAGKLAQLGKLGKLSKIFGCGSFATAENPVILGTWIAPTLLRMHRDGNW